MDEIDAAAWVAESDLLPCLRHLFGTNIPTVGGWTRERMVGGGGEELGVWNLTGTVSIDGVSKSWNVFLKGWAVPRAGSRPQDWDWPEREALLYQSGFLCGLPAAITAPKFFGETQRPDGSSWLWLEGISDEGARWPLERYAVAARHLGRMNGAFLVDRDLPDQAWLSRRWLGQWLEVAGPAVKELGMSGHHPLVRQVLPPPITSAFTRLWHDRYDFLALLHTLPRTFCHLDAFRRNLIFRTRPDGRQEMIAIDCGYAGIAAIGEEIAPLVAATLFFGEFPAQSAQLLEDAVLGAYVEGLHDAGWRGDAELVRTGYVIAVALRYGVGLLRGVLFYILDESNHPRMERMVGMPMSDIVEMFSILEVWVAELSAEATSRLGHGRRQ